MSSRPDDRRRRGAAVKYVVLALLAGLVALVWFVLRPPVPAPQPPVVTPVETIRATVGSLDRRLVFDAHVSSSSVVTILPKVSGTLTHLRADIGTQLASGEAVAQIDPEPYQIAVNQAKAVLDGAKTVFDRQRQLYATGATSEANYDQARTQFENAQSQYELAKLHLSYTTIVSPVGGTVIRRHVSDGALVSPSVPIVTISDNRSLVLKVAVPEQWAGSFQAERASMPMSATIPAMGSKGYSLRVRSIVPAVDVKTKTFMVECNIEGDTSGIMPGMFAQATFTVERRSDVAYLPFGVLVGGNTLWYVDRSGKAQYLTFTPSYFNDTSFEVPLEYANRTFILAGQHFLSAGAPVKATAAPQAAR